jgi:hypothetical protein
MRRDIYAYAVGVLMNVAALGVFSSVSADGACAGPQPSCCVQQNGYVTPYAVGCIDVSADDEYFEGYIQGIIDTLYSEYRIKATVKCSTVYLSHTPCDFVVMDRVIGMVQDIPGVKAIKICKRAPAEYMGYHERQILQDRIDRCGEWLPPYGSLFQPLLADPRQVSHSAALRMGDRTFGPSLAAVSFGDEIPIYRWFDVWECGAMMQIGIESGIFAVFKLNVPSMDLQNADYYVGIPMTYAYKCWSYRLRIYHISSHVGDEFLLLEDHPDFKRTNPSFEALDFFTSYQLTRNIRLYGGVGYYLASDESYPQDNWYIGYGFEIRILGGRDACSKLYWEPIFAAYVANRQFQNWKFDVTCFAGIEVGRNEFIGNRLRFGVEYHDGFSVDGQFQKCRTNWTSLKLSYYF